MSTIALREGPYPGSIVVYEPRLPARPASPYTSSGGPSPRTDDASIRATASPLPLIEWRCPDVSPATSGAKPSEIGGAGSPELCGKTTSLTEEP